MRCSICQKRAHLLKNELLHIYCSRLLITDTEYLSLWKSSAMVAFVRTEQNILSRFSVSYREEKAKHEPMEVFQNVEVVNTMIATAETQ